MGNRRSGKRPPCKLAIKAIFSLHYILIGALTILLGHFLAVVFWESAENYTYQRLGIARGAKHTVLQSLGLGMGGILLALQALASHRRARAMEAAAHEQAEATRNTEQGQRQERLKNSIEHLAHGRQSVRLGGVYELFHLATDTPQFRQTVFDILCAHIRGTTSEKEYQKNHTSKPSEEIQSLLTLLFVQDHAVFKGLHIDLHGSWLNGANLWGARLEKVDLTRAHLKRTVLRKARLQGAILEGARLHQADLSEACLQEAGLRRAHLQMAMLDGAKLQAANLSGAHLQAADLSWAYLHRAILFDMEAGGAGLQGAILRQTELHEADLRQARLQGVGHELSPGETFAQRVIRSTGPENDFSQVTFAGGLKSDKDVESRLKGLSDETASALREELKQHIGRTRSRQLPDDSGAHTIPYTQEEAEKWIAEYEEAMSEVSEDDN